MCKEVLAIFILIATMTALVVGYIELWLSDARLIAEAITIAVGFVVWVFLTAWAWGIVKRAYKE